MRNIFLTTNKIYHSIIATISNLQTGRCVVMVSEDAERTMCTFLGISNELAKEDIDIEILDDTVLGVMDELQSLFEVDLKGKDSEVEEKEAVKVIGEVNEY